MFVKVLEVKFDLIGFQLTLISLQRPSFAPSQIPVEQWIE